MRHRSRQRELLGSEDVVRLFDPARVIGENDRPVVEARVRGGDCKLFRRQHVVCGFVGWELGLGHRGA